MGDGRHVGTETMNSAATAPEGTPIPPPPPDYRSSSPSWAATAVPRRGSPVPWGFLATTAKAGGFLFILIGTLVAVVLASYPASCFTSTCTVNTSASLQYAILTSRLLWTLGAAGIAVGAWLKLHFFLVSPASGTPDGTQLFLAARRAETIQILVAIGILLLLLLNAGTPAPAF